MCVGVCVYSMCVRTYIYSVCVCVYKICVRVCVYSICQYLLLLQYENQHSHTRQFVAITLEVPDRVYVSLEIPQPVKSEESYKTRLLHVLACSSEKRITSFFIIFIFLISLILELWNISWKNKNLFPLFCEDLMSLLPLVGFASNALIDSSETFMKIFWNVLSPSRESAKTFFCFLRHFLAMADFIFLMEVPLQLLSPLLVVMFIGRLCKHTFLHAWIRTYTVGGREGVSMNEKMSGWKVWGI